MEAKFTPGPWSYGGPYTRAIFGNDGREICRMHTRPFPFPSDEEEWRNNALLIAAAPAMYEALRECVKELKAWQKDHGEDICTLAAIDGARAALAATEGRSI